MHAFCTWTSSSRCPTSLDSDLRRRPLLSPASAFPQRQCRWSHIGSPPWPSSECLFSISFFSKLFYRGFVVLSIARKHQDLSHNCFARVENQDGLYHLFNKSIVKLFYVLLLLLIFFLLLAKYDEERLSIKKLHTFQCIFH